MRVGVTVLVLGAVVYATVAYAARPSPYVGPFKCMEYTRGNGTAKRTVECDRRQLDNSQQGQHHSCMAAFDKNMTLQLARCWVGTDAAPCKQSECKAGERGHAYFCCCSAPMCNADAVVVAPTPAAASPDAPISGSHGSHGLVAPSDGHSLASIILLTILPLTLLSVAIIVAYFCVRRYQYTAMIKSRQQLGPSVPSNAPLMLQENLIRGHTGISHLMSNDAYNNSNGLLLQTMPPAYAEATGNAPYTTTTDLVCAAKAKQTASATKLELVANGRFGQVWRGVTNDKRDVAIKVFPEADADSWVQEQEIYSVHSMREHQNILPYWGAEVHPVVDGVPRSEFWLLTQYMHRGSLYHVLTTETLSVAECVQVACGILRGLTFLHDESVTKEGTVTKPTIVHRDLKSANVLLGADSTPYISDFGLAVQCVHGKSMTAHQGYQVGTRRYMAPEVLERACEFSAFAYRQIDVYAAALIVWELLSRTRADRAHEPADYRLPFEAEVGPTPSVAQMEQLVCHKRTRPQVPAVAGAHRALRVLANSMEEMWDQEPEARITAGCAYERCAHLLPCTEEASLVDSDSHDGASTSGDSRLSAHTDDDEDDAPMQAESTSRVPCADDDARARLLADDTPTCTERIASRASPADPPDPEHAVRA